MSTKYGRLGRAILLAGGIATAIAVPAITGTPLLPSQNNDSSHIALAAPAGAILPPVDGYYTFNQPGVPSANWELQSICIQPNGTRAQPGSGERVRAVIQPRNKDAAGAPGAAVPGASLKPAPAIANPRQENTQ